MSETIRVRADKVRPRQDGQPGDVLVVPDGEYEVTDNMPRVLHERYERHLGAVGTGRKFARYNEELVEVRRAPRMVTLQVTVTEDDARYAIEHWPGLSALTPNGRLCRALAGAASVVLGDQ